MQEMYLITFISRYIGTLFSSTFVVYATVMKILFIAATVYLIYLMRKKTPICMTYDKEADGFNYLYICGGVAVLALLTSGRIRDSAGYLDYFIHYLVTFSIWFESLAVLPQLKLLQQLRDVENLTSHYVAAMGLYRLFYI